MSIPKKRVVEIVVGVISAVEGQTTTALARERLMMFGGESIVSALKELVHQPRSPDGKFRINPLKPGRTVN